METKRITREIKYLLDDDGKGGRPSGVERIDIQKPKLDLNYILGKSNLKWNEELSPPKCKACGSSSHRRRFHHNCPFHEKKTKEKIIFQIVPSKNKKDEQKERKDETYLFHQLNETDEANQVASIMMKLGQGEIENSKPLQVFESSLKDVARFGNKRSQKIDENESYASEFCQIIDNSENKSTYSKGENNTYELNNTYKTVNEFETLHEMCTRICMM